MAIQTHLHSSREPAEKGRQEEATTTPGLWKLLLATAALLIMTLGAMELFKEKDKGLAFQRPVPSESRTSLQ